MAEPEQNGEVKDDLWNAGFRPLPHNVSPSIRGEKPAADKQTSTGEEKDNR